MRTGLIRLAGTAFGSVFVALLNGCSDPALPPPSGVMSLTFSTQTGAKAPVCPPADHLANAPVSLSGMPQVTGTGLFSEARDGMNEDWVRCSVLADGAKYQVTGEVISTGVDATGARVTSDVFAHVTIGENEQGALGSVHLSDGATGVGRYVSEACLFSVLPDQGANARLSVSPGRVWAHVTCAQIDDMRNFAGNECALDGYMAFDHCSQ